MFEKVKEKADNIIIDAQKKKQEKQQRDIEKEERKAQKSLEKEERKAKRDFEKEKRDEIRSLKRSSELQNSKRPIVNTEKSN